MLSAQEVKIVQMDWENVTPIAGTAADLFYDRLFEMDPRLRPLFPEDLSEQKKKLMQMLGFAVRGLTDLPALVPAVQALGRRHTGYGVKARDYDSVGAALIWTLKKGLGDGFDAAHEEAWGKTYGVLAKTMIEASAAG